MNKEAHGALVTITGIIAVRLAVSGAYLSYLKEGMRWPLATAGAVCCLLGGTTILRALRGGSDDDADASIDHLDDTEHDHADGHVHTRVAWLLVLPALAVLLVAPRPLGADAAERGSSQAPAVVDLFGPLPAATDGAVAMSLSEFLQRSYYDDENSLAGATVRLQGFVATKPEIPDGYRLTRFALSCCAADAYPLQVEVHGIDGAIPDDNTWVEVVGQWIEPPPGTELGVDRGAAMTFTSATLIDPPTDPYE